jgi:peptidoglycan hydrolase-like protein with peptidoglycan-binding domain
MLAYVYFAFIAQQCQMIVGRPDVQPWMDAIKASHAVPKPNFDDWDTEAAEAFDELMASVNLDPENQDDRRKFCGGIPIDAPPPPTSCDNTNNARQALKLGDAAQANDNTEKARACWRRSISLAQEDPEDRDGAEAAMEAERRLKTFTSTCKINEESLAAISRDYKARSGDLLSVKVLQQSLTALGQYDGPIDGELTEATREAIRKFQGDRDEDKTGMLSPEQTVRLVCTAAESTSDNVSQTTLGIMNATGLGVQPDRDLALNWLKKAEGRNYPDAKYNLAIIYGTGIVLDSYRLCDVARAPEQADKFLQEAARLKHPIALALMKLYGPGSRYEALTPAERWQLIESQQLERSNQDKTGLYAQRLRNIGAQCGPDRSIR